MGETADEKKLADAVTHFTFEVLRGKLYDILRRQFSLIATDSLKRDVERNLNAEILSVDKTACTIIVRVSYRKTFMEEANVR